MEGFPYRRAVVTGGAGFIGSHLVEGLLALGVEVVSVDDYSAGKAENLVRVPNPGLLRQVKCDVTDERALRRCLEGAEIVFHNAASKKTVCLRDPRRDLEVNAKGAFNILALARDCGVAKVVHASTGSVYGEPQCRPQDEQHPLCPTSYYGVSKLAGEMYAHVFHELYGLDVTVLRYFHVYGPRQESADGKGGVIAIFARRALSGQPLVIFGDGTQQRSFTYVKDVVAANLLVAAHPEARGKVYNCASGVRIMIGELARRVLVLSGQPDLPVQYEDWATGDIKEFDVDNSRLRGLGFEFSYGFERGLSETLEWYRRQGSQPNEGVQCETSYTTI